MDHVTKGLLVACREALVLLEGVADEEIRNGKRNAAMNVRAVEKSLLGAITEYVRVESARVGSQAPAATPAVPDQAEVFKKALEEAGDELQALLDQLRDPYNVGTSVEEDLKDITSKIEKVLEEAEKLDVASFPTQRDVVRLREQRDALRAELETVIGWADRAGCSEAFLKKPREVLGQTAPLSVAWEEWDRHELEAKAPATAAKPLIVVHVIDGIAGVSVFGVDAATVVIDWTAVRGGEYGKNGEDWAGFSDEAWDALAKWEPTTIEDLAEEGLTRGEKAKA